MPLAHSREKAATHLWLLPGLAQSLVLSRGVHLGLQDLGSDPVFKHSKLLAASHKADCHNKGLTRILMSLAREKDAV